MASPPSGLNPQQVQEWADSLISNSLKRGFNPGDVGMGSQQDRDRWAQQLQGTSPQPNTPAPTGNVPNMSAYTPGKAQPTQTPSQGTPYGQLPTTGSPATSYADAWNAAMPKGGHGVTFTPARSVIGAGAGNMAYAQPSQRPEGFVTQSYDLQGNPVAQGQQAQQRDAFIAQILQTPRDTPQYDFQGMLGKAGDMVKDGWQNPFNFNQPLGQAVARSADMPPDLQEQLKPRTTQYRPGMYEEFTNDDARNWLSFYERQNQPTGPQSLPGGQPSSPGVQGRPDNRMAIQDLFTKNNIQAPQGFMDQLIALLGGSAPPSQMPPVPGGAPEPNAPGSPPRMHMGEPLPAAPDGYHWDTNNNLKYNGKYDPKEYYNDEGRVFNGSISFTPEATAEERRRGYEDFARKSGYYKRDETGGRIDSPSAPSIPRPGAAQSTQPQGLMMPYVPPTVDGGRRPPAPTPQLDWGLQRPVGKRLLFRGDMGIPEEYIGTEAFERLMRDEAARPTPPYLPIYASVQSGQSAPPNLPQQTVSPPPVANPVTPPKQNGTPYGQMTPPRVQPKPPPPRVLTDADVAAQEEAIRRVKSQAWVSANPNNWFMNPYNQDSPLVREVRSRNPTVNKSGNGGGGSSNKKFTRVNGQLKWT